MISFGTGIVYAIGRKRKIGPGCFLRRRRKIGTVTDVTYKPVFSPETFSVVHPDQAIVVEIPFVEAEIS